MLPVAERLPKVYKRLQLLPAQLLSNQLLPAQLLPVQLLPAQLLSAQLLPTQLLPTKLLWNWQWPGGWQWRRELPRQMVPPRLPRGGYLPAPLLCGEQHTPNLLPAAPCPGLLLPPILLWTVLLPPSLLLLLLPPKLL
ncbi:Keratin, high-sulfur matrix protein, B2C [Microtus ochrogaster]|uniref:Keratin, high-sulfur matrix protein, B2C n=1 Tax=Microtus ochrogaster TaxID=79684 RepID=A0A8J6KKT5_MICOH|nr:Keratin, high-sulfur matrix protein, B2C [Microtus ochrogaster]